LHQDQNSYLSLLLLRHLQLAFRVRQQLHSPLHCLVDYLGYLQRHRHLQFQQRDLAMLRRRRLKSQSD
jgi:hypothetical protein